MVMITKKHTTSQYSYTSNNYTMMDRKLYMLNASDLEKMFFIENLVFSHATKKIYVDFGEAKSGYEELLEMGYFLERSISDAYPIFKKYGIRNIKTNDGHFRYVINSKGKTDYKALLLTSIEATHLRNKFKSTDAWQSYSRRNIFGKMLNVFCNIQLIKQRKIGMSDLNFIIKFFSEYQTKHNIKFYYDKEMESFFNFMINRENYDSVTAKSMIIKTDENEDPDEASLSIIFDNPSDKIEYEFINGKNLVFKKKTNKVKIAKRVKDPFNQVKSDKENLIVF